MLTRLMISRLTKFSAVQPKAKEQLPKQDVFRQMSEKVGRDMFFIGEEISATMELAT